MYYELSSYNNAETLIKESRDFYNNFLDILKIEPEFRLYPSLDSSRKNKPAYRCAELNDWFRRILHPYRKKFLTPLFEVDFYSQEEKIALEVQFAHYSLACYDIFTKLPILYKTHHIKAGIEILPLKRMWLRLPRSRCSFEKIVDFIQIHGIDYPLLLVGVDV